MGTKLILTYVLIAAAFIEGLLYVLMPTFPLSQVLSFQGLMGGGYLGVRVATNIATIKKNGGKNVSMD